MVKITSGFEGGKWRNTVGDDSAGLGRNLELFGCEFENGSERGSFGHAKSEREQHESSHRKFKVDLLKEMKTNHFFFYGGLGYGELYGHFERKLGIRGERDLEWHLPTTSARHLLLKCSRAGLLVLRYGITDRYQWGWGIIVGKSRPKVGVHCLLECE